MYYRFLYYLCYTLSGLWVLTFNTSLLWAFAYWFILAILEGAAWYTIGYLTAYDQDMYYVFENTDGGIEYWKYTFIYYFGLIPKQDYESPDIAPLSAAHRSLRSKAQVAKEELPTHIIEDLEAKLDKNNK